MQRETRCVSAEGRLTRVQLQEDFWAGDTQECSFFLDDVASIAWTLAALAPSIMCGDTILASAEHDSGSVCIVGGQSLELPNFGLQTQVCCIYFGMQQV